ncbi:MAG TPA: ABC transporter substrate-binding protein [Xanthobacteraceae bacterium]|nr:ABC transporter substrate-binding protein [Xanthobacteraceae bacterium]
MRTMASCGAQLVGRRTVLKIGLASTLEIASPFPISARGEEPIKIGMVEPLSGVYQKLANAEVGGARLALEEINRSGGVLGREAQLLVEDSANDITVGVAKTRHLIDHDQVDFVLGDVNSAVALATMRVTAEKRKLHIVTGGHTDEITGKNCSWNVFRICKTTTMEANAIADTLVEKFGKRWYFLTPDYVYGAALQAAFERKLREHGGAWAGDVIALGTVDYSRSLLNAGAYRPNVLINLMGGADQSNSLAQIVRYGLLQDMAVGGALFELESILAVPEAAQIGWWTMEWWWNQPDVPDVKAFDQAIRRRTGLAASARSWFGYAAVHTLARIANQEKSLDPVVLAQALQGYTMPPAVALEPDRAYFRGHDHQLMSAILVGEVHPPRSDPFDVFTTRAIVKADQAAEPAEANSCRLAFPG